jgi:hypothetical protein
VRLIASLTWLADQRSKTVAKRWGNNRFWYLLGYDPDIPPLGATPLIACAPGEPAHDEHIS